MLVKFNFIPNITFIEISKVLKEKKLCDYINLIPRYNSNIYGYNEN